MSHGIPDLRSLYAAAIGHSTSDGVLESEEQARLMERFQLVLSELDRFRSASARAQRMELDRIQTKFQAGMGRPGLKTRETSPPEKSTSPRPPASAPSEAPVTKSPQAAPETPAPKTAGKVVFGPFSPPRPMPPGPGPSRR